MIEIMKSIVSLFIKIFTIPAIKIPMNNIYNILPNFVKSVLVVYPRIAIPAKAPAATKNVETIEAIEYTRKIVLKLNPIKAA